MAKVVETRIAKCRYGNEEKKLNDFSVFGWFFVSKRIIDKSDNPLPIDKKVSKAELRDKYYYELTLQREIDDSVSDELNELQQEYETNKLLNNKFSEARIAGIIGIQIGVFVLMFIGIFAHLRGIGGGIAVFIFGLACGTPFPFIISDGCKRVIRANKKNIVIQKYRDEITEKAKALLKN